MDIKINNVTKSYGGILALDNCTLCVKAGEIFSLLGPNGAGKTTLVKLMLDLLNLDTGEILLGGEDFRKVELREKISYLPEKFNFFPYYTVEKAIRLVGKLRLALSSNGKCNPESYQSVMQKVGINELARRKIKTLSKGQLQRVGLGQLLVCDLMTPRLFILDEPFSGLDPLGIRDIKNLIYELHDKGHTIFINSHILSEVEQISKSIAILNRGKILAQGNIEDLKKGGRSLEDYFCDTIKHT